MDCTKHFITVTSMWDAYYHSRPTNVTQFVHSHELAEVSVGSLANSLLLLKRILHGNSKIKYMHCFLRKVMLAVVFHRKELTALVQSYVH